MTKTSLTHEFSIPNEGVMTLEDIRFLEHGLFIEQAGDKRRFFLDKQGKVQREMSFAFLPKQA